jgi:hypothetical protein
MQVKAKFRSTNENDERAGARVFGKYLTENFANWGKGLAADERRKPKKLSASIRVYLRLAIGISATS